jgi:hypothetical protein
VFDAAKNLAVKVAPGAKTGVYGLIKVRVIHVFSGSAFMDFSSAKSDLQRQTLKAVAKDYRQVFPAADDAVARSRL